MTEELNASAKTTVVTKAELAEMLQAGMVERADRRISRTDLKILIDVLVSSIIEAMSQGKSVRVDGLGTFVTKTYSATQRVNPQDRNQVLNVPERDVPGFRPSGALKYAVRHKTGLVADDAA